MKIHHFKKILLALSITAFLSACGGGGSDDPVVVDDSIDATISGKAAKGIIIGGLVVAAELNLDKTVKNTNVGSATTDSVGKYSLALNSSYTGGPIKITITAGDATTMVCDATSGCGSAVASDPLDINSSGTIDFGEKYKPGSLSMSALLADAEDGETIAVQITPFTHMAAARAQASATINAASIRAANSEVSNLLGGIDILRTEPIDITALTGNEDPVAVIYAALGAAIAELADDDGTGAPDIQQILTSLENEFSDGIIPVTLLANINTQLVNVFTQVGAVDTSGVLTALQKVVADAEIDNIENIDPTPSDYAGDTDVEKAKAFLTDLRTWGVTISGEIENPSQTFQNQVDLSNQAADMVLVDDVAGEAVGMGIEAIIDFSSGVITTTDLTGYTGQYGSFTSGTISKVTDSNGDVYTISNANALFSGATATLDMVMIAPEEGVHTAGTTLTLGIKSITAEGSDNLMVSDGGIATVILNTDYDIDYNAVDAPAPSIDEVKLDFNVSLTQKMTVINNEAVPANDPVKFTGNLKTTLYPYADSNGEILDVVPGSFMMSGTVSNTTGDSYDMNVSASIPAAATLEPINTVYDLDSTYASNNGSDLIYWVISENEFFYQNPDENYTVTFNPLEESVHVVIESSFLGSIDVTYPGPYTSWLDFSIQQGEFYPNDYTYYLWVDGQGGHVRDQSIWNPDYSVSGAIDFFLDEPEVEFFNSTQPLIGTIGLQFTAQFAGLPAASVSITGNATAFEQGNADATISFGTRMLKFTAANDTAAGEEASLEITNQDGVKLLLTGTNLNDLHLDNDGADVTINGNVIATVIGLDNGGTKVTYIDGTFEIF